MPATTGAAAAAANKSTARGNPAFYKDYWSYVEDENGNNIPKSETVLGYLNDQSKDCLTEHGRKEYEQLPPDIKGMLSKEVFGSLETKTLEEIQAKCKENHEHWNKEYEIRSWRRRIQIAKFAAEIMEKVLKEIAKSVNSEERLDRTDALISLVAEMGKRSDTMVSEESQQPVLGMASLDSVSTTQVQDYIEGRRLNHLMFAEGENRIQLKVFAFPGWGDNETSPTRSDARSKMSTADFLEKLGLECTLEQIEPHAERLRNVRKCLKAAIDAESNETLTQNLFFSALAQLLLTFSPDHEVYDVTDMASASTNIEVCGSYFEKQAAKKKKKQKTNGVVSPEASEPHKAKRVQLRLKSDLVIKKVDPRKQEELSSRDLFLNCDVNIEMKTFESMRTAKRAEKTQLCGESMMIASESTSNRNMICSVVTDCVGICVLLHEKKEHRKDDMYFMSRWETDVERMLAILLWVVKFSTNGNASFEDSGFAVQDAETEWDADESPTKGNGGNGKRNFDGSPTSNRPTGLAQVKESAEEDKEVEIIGLFSDDESSDEEEEQKPHNIVSYALSQSLYGRHMPLVSPVLQAKDERNKSARTFCFSTGQWKSVNIIQKDGHAS